MQATSDDPPAAAAAAAHMLCDPIRLGSLPVFGILTQECLRHIHTSAHVDRQRINTGFNVALSRAKDRLLIAV